MKRHEENSETVSPLTIAVLALLVLACMIAPWAAYFRFGPIWGLLTAIIAFVSYIQFGPSAMPGFLSGLLAMWVSITDAGCGLTSLVSLITRFVRHAH